MIFFEVGKIKWEKKSLRKNGAYWEILRILVDFNIHTEN